jgi:7-keto-8-aminopelargonate synthetase-like enzyme
VRIAVGDEGRELRARLKANVKRLRESWHRLGLESGQAPAPWLTVCSPEIPLAAISQKLLRDGILLPHVEYFGTPPGGALRASLSALHREKHIQQLESALGRALKGG